MSIETLKMSGFRNHKKKYLEFGPGVNVIWGENGSGKTSTLEAIHILSVGKSFRTPRLQETIEEGSPNARLVGVFVSEKKKKEIIVSHSKDRRKKITINKFEASPKEIFGQNPIVLLSPEEQKITNGTPADRRRYFDKTFSTTSKTYLQLIVDYSKTLKQKNALLKKQGPSGELDAWDEKLSFFGTAVWEQRRVLYKKYQAALLRVCSLYGKNEISVSVIGNAQDHTKETLFEELKKNRQKDILYGHTSAGPHTDKPAVFYNNKDIRLFGSQGEHKISLVLIKLAEYQIVRNATQLTPTVLLDDLFATLDFERSNAVLSLLEKNTQTIITNTDLVDIKNHGIKIDGKKNKSIHLLRKCKN